MRAAKRFLDKYAMTELARRTLAELKEMRLPPVELNRLETSLKEGNVGEVYILSGLLKTVLDESSPDASQRKLLRLYQELEHCCYSLIELGRHVSELELWRLYKPCGYETFESFCVEVLQVSPARVRILGSLGGRGRPRPGKADIAQLFSWLFDIAEIMSGANGADGPGKNGGMRP